MGGFAIGARVALLWQGNANPSYKLASISRYDDIVRTAGWAGSANVTITAHLKANLKHTCLPPSWPSSASVSLYQRIWRYVFFYISLRASTGAVLTTKRERKMLASACLYSLYACSFTVWTICISIHHSKCGRLVPLFLHDLRPCPWIPLGDFRPHTS